LEAVADVRQRPSDDDAHRVVDVRRAHLVLDRHRANVADAVHLHALAPAACRECRECRECRAVHSPPVPVTTPYRSLRAALSEGAAPRYLPEPSAMTRPSAPRTSPLTS